MEHDIPWRWIVPLIAVSFALAWVFSLQQVVFWYGGMEFEGCIVPEVSVACTDSYDCMADVCDAAGGVMWTGQRSVECGCSRRAP